MKASSCQQAAAVFAVLFLAGLLPAAVRAQGTISCGETVTGIIGASGDHDTWTFTANAGDALIVRIGEMTQSGAGDFNPQITLFSPTSTQLVQRHGTQAAEISASAPVSGTYTIVVDDNSPGEASCSYLLTLVRTGGSVVVTPGDDGGALTNGFMHSGMVEVGDLDVWTVTANAGEAFAVRVGNIFDPEPMLPTLRLYAPDGTQLDIGSGNKAAEVTAAPTVGGTFLVVVGDHGSGLSGHGAYRLTLGRPGAPVVTVPGDEGGPIGVALEGIISMGDMDLWTLPAHAGDQLVVTMEEVVSLSSLNPQLRLYSPAGELLRTNSQTATAQVSIAAPTTGTYLVLAADGSNGFLGVGGYRLSLAGTSGVAELPVEAEQLLAPAWPNPFAARTVLGYRVSRTGAVELRVFDAQGRLVRTLVDAPTLPAGSYQASWDGRDAGGRPSSPGTYFGRFESGGRVEVQKLVLTR